VIQAVEPPAVVATAPLGKAAEVVVVSRETRSEVVVARDTPLPLIKAAKTEDALLRQAVFMTSSFSVVRPASGAGEEVLRWTHKSYLQRQLCVTSITGLFSCAVAEIEELTEKGEGEAPHSATPGQAAPGPNTAAEAARIALVTALRARAAALFDDDRRLKFLPMLRAAGVSLRRPPVSAGADARRSP
jgi:hypothetical protein